MHTQHWTRTWCHCSKVKLADMAHHHTLSEFLVLHFKICHLPTSWSWILNASRSSKRSSSCKEATKTSAQRGVVNTLIPPPLPRYILRHGTSKEARLNHRKEQDTSATLARQQRYIFSSVSYNTVLSTSSLVLIFWCEMSGHYNKSYMQYTLILNQLLTKYRGLSVSCSSAKDLGTRPYKIGTLGWVQTTLVQLVVLLLLPSMACLFLTKIESLCYWIRYDRVLR